MVAALFRKKLMMKKNKRKSVIQSYVDAVGRKNGDTQRIAGNKSLSAKKATQKILSRVKRIISFV